MTDELTVPLFCDIHINKGATLNLLQCLLHVICGCRAVQTNSAEISYHWHCCICSYYHNIISSGSPPVFLECTSLLLFKPNTHLFVFFVVTINLTDLCIIISLSQVTLQLQIIYYSVFVLLVTAAQQAVEQLPSDGGPSPHAPPLKIPAVSLVDLSNIPEGTLGEWLC